MDHQKMFENHGLMTAAALLSQQREWHKTIGHDLLKFEGTPEHWSEYLNRYQTSKEKYGYDSKENMSRLHVP